jgi:outer membrane protein assembly factor BamB
MTPSPGFSGRTFLASLFTLVCVLCNFAAATPASDGLIASPEHGWPQWRGPQRDAISREKSLLTAWPESGPPLRWKRDGLGLGWASPIVAGGSIYLAGDVGDELVIFAFDLDGKPRWRSPNGASWKGPYPGARASCVFSEGRLYQMNAHGRVACFNAVSGAEIWAVNVLERFEGKVPTWAMSECLLVDGPRLIVTPGGRKALMATLDKKTGATVWTTEPVPGELASYCSPILLAHSGRRLLVNCTSSNAWAVDADSGKMQWKTLQANPNKVTTATPVYGKGAVFLCASGAKEAGQYLVAAPADQPAPNLLWSSPLDTLTGGAVLVDGHLFASGCKTERTLHCINWDTGASLYQLARPNPATARWAATAMLWAGGRLYCVFENGWLALLRPTENSFEVTGQFQWVDAKKGDAWAHPVVLDGRLYLRHHDSLWCYDVRPK